MAMLKNPNSMTWFTWLALAWLQIGSTAFSQEAQDLSSLKQSLQKIKVKTQNPTGESAAEIDTRNPLYRQTLESVGYIVCQTEDRGAWQGTGWILNVQNRLMVTNQHVIKGVEECTVFLPEFKDNKLVTDKAETLRSSRGIRARVIDSSPECDLALIQLESLTDTAKSLSLAEQSATPGQRLHSIAGNSAGSDSLWIYSTGHVRQVARGILANGYESTLLESDMATNQGNSGGPVVNDQGQLVAVVEGHRTDARLVSIYVDLQAVVSYLEDGLRCVAPKTYEDLEHAIRRHYAEGRFDTALKLATQAHKLDKTLAQPIALRGWCFLKKDDLDTARIEFEKAIRLDEQCGDAHAGLGQLAMIDEEYDLAIEHFSAAVGCDADNSSYQVSRAQARLLNYDYETARKEFQRVLKGNPDAHEAMLGLGEAETQLGNYQAGMEQFDKLLTRYPAIYRTNADLFYQSGVAFEGMEDLENAVGCYARCIELDPEQVEARRELGGIFVQAEEFARALEILHEANALYGEDAYIHFYLGAAYVGLGDAATGRPYLNSALELDSEDESLAEEVNSLLAFLDSQTN